MTYEVYVSTYLLQFSQVTKLLCLQFLKPEMYLSVQLEYN